MGQTCRKPAWFAFYDRIRIEQTLERMSEQGWIIQKMGAYFWTYQRTEAKKRHVTVTYVADASEFNAAPTAGQQELEELAAQDGWELKAAWGQMQIYYNDREDPVPMETDPVTQVENMHRAMKKNIIPGSLGNLLLSVAWIAMFLFQLRLNPVEFLSSPVQILLIPDGVLMLLSSLIDLIGAWRWYEKARKAAENGVYLEAGRHKVLSWILTALSFAVLVLMLASFGGRWGLLIVAVLPMALVICVFKWLMKALKARGCSRQANFAITIAVSGVLAFVLIMGVSLAAVRLGIMEDSKPVGTFEKYGRVRKVYAEALPLRLEDLQETGDMEYSLEKRGHESIFAAHYEYRQWPLTEDADWTSLDYEVTDVKMPAVYDLLLRQILKNKDEVDHGEVILVDHYEPIGPGSWYADAAYQLHWGDSTLEHYVLCYGNRIVELPLDWTPTAEQKQTVADVFRP